MKKILAISLLICLAAFADEKGSFADSRDSKTYKTIKIGAQTWMAENLNYAASGSKCGDAYGYLKDENTENCDKYGRLYNWGAALKACPQGWHLPSDSEWDVLMKVVGGSSTAGRKLKASSGWKNCGLLGSGSSLICEDAFGFAALPGGSGELNGDFGYGGYVGNWWSASESDANYACSRRILYDYDLAYWYLNLKTLGFSVRCLKD
jgi:uncharacterized protein (TIGR02145 family)